MAQNSRPTSPHLSVYKPEITMVMSIMHRITGMGLYAGFAVLTWWLTAAAWGQDALNVFNAVVLHPLGQLVLFGFTWALFHHMLGGIRHFIWDMGAGFSREARFGLAWVNAFGGLALALAVWAMIIWL